MKKKKEIKIKYPKKGEEETEVLFNRSSTENRIN